MSKLVPLLFAGAGTATVSVGGFYLVKESVGGAGGAVAANPDSTNLKFDTLQKFKSNSGGKCTKDMFGESVVDFGVEVANADKATIEGNFLGAAPSDNESSSTRSCLIINWEKKIDGAPNNNWRGTFT